MPNPKPNESRDDFVTRCVPVVLDDESAEDQDQAVAMCNSIWKQSKKEQETRNGELLSMVRSRCEKQTEFNYGILTADRYVKTLLDVVGVQSCYRHMSRAAKGNWVSFDDVVQKAAKTLAYCNPEMTVKAKQKEVKLPDGVERPKNTLMMFRHVLTTSTKDRDGDILRTKGAKVDPKMLMLWQHVHTLPIGKMLALAEEYCTDSMMQLYSCIIDMNELCHDSAVMIDNDMGRFSHGFRALDFLEIKEGDREQTGGFDVKSFEILEESLVTVPANPDAETQEVILSLVEKGKLTSGLMKDYGAGIRGHRTLSVPVELDVKLLVNGLEVKSDADESRDKARDGEGIGSGSPEETKDVQDEGREKEAEGKEVKSSEAAVTVGRPTYTGDLSGSWEWTGQTLRMKATPYLLGMGIGVGENDWVNVVGTFKDHAIICVERRGQYEYYKADWTMIKGQPEFRGEPKKVVIETTTEIVEKMMALKIEGEKKKQLVDDDESGGSEAVPAKPGSDEDDKPKMACPECDYVGPGKDGKCPKCGAKLVIKKDHASTKAGRVLNKANESKIREAIDDLADASKMDGVSRACKALIGQARRGLSEVLASLGVEQVAPKHFGVKEAIAVVLAEGREKELKVLKSMLEAFEEGRRRDDIVKQFDELLS